MFDREPHEKECGHHGIASSEKEKNGQRVNTPHRLHARTHIAVNRGKMNIKCRPCMLVGEIRVGYTSSYAYLLGHLHEIEMS